MRLVDPHMRRSGDNEVSRELRFMSGCFRDHYRREHVIPPYRFTRREWGFFPFGGKMMFRHIGFLKQEEVDSFFRESAPMHAYYSVAYYGDPVLQPMGEKFKTWMGSDLIFDLDADHLPEADSMTYPEQLAEVKEEVKRLLFEFILGDLGLPEEHTYLHFSGGRGYHVHVRSPEVMTLDSRDRRQIVDYITGRNLDFEVLFPPKVKDYNPKYHSYKMTRNFRIRDFGGWVKRIYEGKDALMKELESMERKNQITHLMKIASDGKIKVGEQALGTIVDKIFWESKGKSATRVNESDIFDVFPMPHQLETFLNIVVAFSSIHLKGETDEPVTTDIKRLIRCPGSLHGKTGLKVIEIDKHSIDDFDPLVNAIALSDDPVNVDVQEPFSMSMNGTDWNLEPGPVTVPKYLAYFLVARRLALIS